MNDLSARALLKLEEARRYVLRDEDDASRDDLLVDAVNDVSDSIWDYCLREFRDTTADPGPDARAFEYDGSGWLSLAPFDLRELTSVELYTDRAAELQATLTADYYRLRPTGRSRGGTYLALELPTPAIEESDYGFSWEVTVTGEWGMEAVPGAVKLACKQWVENIVKNPGSFASQTQAGYSVIPEVEFTARRAGMPPSVQHRLERWRRNEERPIRVVRFRHPDSFPPAVPHRLPTL